MKTHQLLDDQAKSMGLGLARFDARHPLFEGMVDSVEKKQIVGLTRVQTHTLMLLEPDASEERDILAHFTDDTPAMVEKQVGEGRVIFWATTLDRDWSDMAIRPGFVPLINQIVLYLTGQLANPRTWLHDAGSSHVLCPHEAFRKSESKAPKTACLPRGNLKPHGRGRATPTNRPPAKIPDRCCLTALGNSVCTRLLSSPRRGFSRLPYGSLFGKNSRG